MKKKKRLTASEIKVLAEVIKGKNNREIAQELYITHHTVKAHIGSILRKLGLSNRVEVAVYAVVNHLLEVHSENLE